MKKPRSQVAAEGGSIAAAVGVAAGVGTAKATGNAITAAVGVAKGVGSADGVLSSEAEELLRIDQTHTQLKNLIAGILERSVPPSPEVQAIFKTMVKPDPDNPPPWVFGGPQGVKRSPGTAHKRKHPQHAAIGELLVQLIDDQDVPAKQVLAQVKEQFGAGRTAALRYRGEALKRRKYRQQILAAARKNPDS